MKLPCVLSPQYPGSLKLLNTESVEQSSTDRLLVGAGFVTTGYDKVSEPGATQEIYSWLLKWAGFIIAWNTIYFVVLPIPDFSSKSLGLE